MGWLLVMFDLPVVEDAERKKASRFRMDLLDLGFYMLQESVYLRNCVTQEKQKQFLDKVQNIAPNKGCITAIYVTDKQWQNSVNIALFDKKSPRSIEGGTAMAAQMSLW